MGSEMPKVTYIAADDTEFVVDVPIGTSLMQAASLNCIEGIVGDCGGAMTCATCHVLVEPEFLPLLAAVSESEDQMLDYTAAGRQENSRLSCQIVMTEGLDGLVVRMADPQL